MENTEKVELHADLSKCVFEKADWSVVSPQAHASRVLRPSPTHCSGHSYNQRTGSDSEDRGG